MVLMLYICINKSINDMETQEKKLRCKMSTFKSELSFNEWSEKYNVGRGYVEPTKYFQGNPSCGVHPIGVCREEVISPFEKFFRMFIKK
jgi:hypothetical protein